MRLFLGIPLSPEIHQQFVAFMNYHPSTQGIRWTKETNLHVTACFIGDTNADSIEEINQKVNQIVQITSRFQLSFDLFRFVPKRQPKMIWGQFKKNEAFSAIINQLHQALGLKKDYKEPIPHVTLARMKTRINFHIHSETFMVPDLPVNELVLWESELSPQGPGYYEKARFVLQ